MKLIKIFILLVYIFHLYMGEQLIMHYCAGSLCEINLGSDISQDGCCGGESEEDEGCCQSLVIQKYKPIQNVSENSFDFQYDLAPDLAQAEVKVAYKVHFMDLFTMPAIEEFGIPPSGDFRLHHLRQRRILYHS